MFLSNTSELRATLRYMVKHEEITAKQMYNVMHWFLDCTFVTRTELEIACDTAGIPDWAEEIWSRLNEQE